MRTNVAAEEAEVVSREMAAVLRRKTPAERLEIGYGMWRCARRMLTARASSQSIRIGTLQNVNRRWRRD